MLLSAGMPSLARAQETTSDAASDPAQIEAASDGFQIADAFVVDLRRGDDDVRAPSREAFAQALSEHGELGLSADTELRSILSRAPYSAILEQGKLALAGAAVAYSSLDCPGAQSRSEQAILDLAAANAANAPAQRELRQAYLFRFLCAHRNGQVDEAMAAARILHRLSDGRPTEISESTWDQYPVLDAQSNQLQVPVAITSDPEGASIFVDFEQRGVTPARVFLNTGEHVVAMGSKEGAVSQRITVTGPGRLQLPLHKVKSHWQGLADSVEALRIARGTERQKAMRTVMAAIEAQVAFVMREPGRISVWVLPEGRRYAQHVGHAPNASIAGSLALEALHESRTAPGLDPDMPLLREDDTTVTRSASNRRWWVYGVVLGAAVVGGGFIVAKDLSEDTQRIEVSLP